MRSLPLLFTADCPLQVTMILVRGSTQEILPTRKR